MKIAMVPVCLVLLSTSKLCYFRRNTEWYRGVWVMKKYQTNLIFLLQSNWPVASRLLRVGISSEDGGKCPDKVKVCSPCHGGLGLWLCGHYRGNGKDLNGMSWLDDHSASGGISWFQGWYRGFTGNECLCLQEMHNPCIQGWWDSMPANHLKMVGKKVVCAIYLQIVHMFEVI